MSLPYVLPTLLLTALASPVRGGGAGLVPVPEGFIVAQRPFKGFPLWGKLSAPLTDEGVLFAEPRCCIALS
jgi:hypothetical protein